MNVGNGLFWLLIASLLGSSTYFGLNAEAQRREVQRIDASLQSGAEVSLVSIIDGDTVVVKDERGASVAVRLLGIKAFDPSREKQAESRFGRNAMDALDQLLTDRMAVVQLNEPSKDKYGRTLARLKVGDRDVGLSLVKKGLVLVYTAFPFPNLADYLQEQEKARGAKKGLWADADVSRQADLLDREWRRQAR